MPDRSIDVRERMQGKLLDLRSKAHIQERPFVSYTPVVGRFIAWFREQWNSVAAKWYVRPMIQQQNAFNHVLVQMLQELVDIQADLNREIYERLDELDQRAIGSDHDITLSARIIAEDGHRLRQLQKRLEQLEETLLNMHRKTGQ